MIILGMLLGAAIGAIVIAIVHILFDPQTIRSRITPFLPIRTRKRKNSRE